MAFDEKYEEFVPPPDCPVFEPTEEEFTDPILYIEKIKPIAEHTGICKIRPPSSWQPPFAVNVDEFKFTPRLQRINELEARSRVKLNYFHQLARFWELQGVELKVPIVDKRPLDLFSLKNIVFEQNGYDFIVKHKKWGHIAQLLGFDCARANTLKNHYEKIILPFNISQESANDNSSDLDIHIKEEISPVPSLKSRMGKYTRRSVRPTCPDQVKQPSPDEVMNNPELKKLQFYGAGPKMKGCGLNADSSCLPKWKKKDTDLSQLESELEPVIYSSEDSPSKRTRQRTSPHEKKSKVCQICHTRGTDFQLLVCESCDCMYHTFCLKPPLREVPTVPWSCPVCIVKAIKTKTSDPYGFEQSNKEFSLQEFGEAADKYKQNYFNMPAHMVPTELVEKEFWRLVTALDEDVTVMYGADLHTMDHGSGFPHSKQADMTPEDMEYVNAPWNLNVLPITEKSVMRYISVDISGMKVPWIYIGMCFSTFCWHVEDHWSYSINYMHWGEPKTWYGVPHYHAEKLEETMKKAAPELFESQADLMHHLVTIINPNVLIKNGVNVFRANQCAGEYIVTFPRAYHAGFNHGYNCAEAVNFCPADWIPMGRQCIEHYKEMHRPCVFSHDELIWQMIDANDQLDPDIADYLFNEIHAMVKGEQLSRRELLSEGVSKAEMVRFEEIPDDFRQCKHCLTTCFLSSLTCSCIPNKMTCLQHREHVCDTCPSENKILKYRFSLDEMFDMLEKTKRRAEFFPVWFSKAKHALAAWPGSKLPLEKFKQMITEGKRENIPHTETFDQLQAAVCEAEAAVVWANQLTAKKQGEKGDMLNEANKTPKLTLDELCSFLLKVQSLPCELTETEYIQDIVDQVQTLQDEIIAVLSGDKDYGSIKGLEKLYEQADSSDVEIKETKMLSDFIQEVKWKIELKIKLKDIPVDMSDICALRDSAALLPSRNNIQSELDEIQRLCECEEKANACLKTKNKYTLEIMESIFDEYGNKSVPILMSVSLLGDFVRKGKEWVRRVDALLKSSSHPYCNVYENLIATSRELPFQFKQLIVLENIVSSSKEWKQRVAKIFLSEDSKLDLLDVLTPRNNIKSLIDQDHSNATVNSGACIFSFDFASLNPPSPQQVYKQYSEAQSREIEELIELRDYNVTRSSNDQCSKESYCVCRQNYSGFMFQCELCRDWFHKGCVPLPTCIKRSLKSDPSASVMHSAFQDIKYLCPHCYRSKRPKLEKVLGLVVALEELPIRIPEGEALQCLVQRSMLWQEKVSHLFNREKYQSILQKLGPTSKNVSASGDLDMATNVGTVEVHDLVEDVGTDKGILGLTSLKYNYPSSINFFPASKDDSNVSHCVDFDDDTLELAGDEINELDRLMIEGDLLEINMNETHQLWYIMQKVQAALISSSELSSNAKQKKKRKTSSSPTLTLDATEVDDTDNRLDENSSLHSMDGDFPSQTDSFVKRKRSRSGEFAKKPRSQHKKSRFKTTVDRQSSFEEETDTECAILDCQKPIGDDITWVQCDSCEKWYHLNCIGLSSELAESEDFICHTCKSHTETTFSSTSQAPQYSTDSSFDSGSISNLDFVPEHSSTSPNLTKLTSHTHNFEAAGCLNFSC